MDKPFRQPPFLIMSFIGQSQRLLAACFFAGVFTTHAQVEWVKPSIGAIAKAYEKAYRGAASRRQAARRVAMDFDADAVTVEYWKPALDVLAEKVAK